MAQRLADFIRPLPHDRSRTTRATNYIVHVAEGAALENASHFLEISDICLRNIPFSCFIVFAFFLFSANLLFFFLFIFSKKIDRNCRVRKMKTYARKLFCVVLYTHTYAHAIYKGILVSQDASDNSWGFCKDARLFSHVLVAEFCIRNIRICRRSDKKARLQFLKIMIIIFIIIILQ